MSKTKKDFPKEKNVTLRAFQIENKCISQDGSDLKKTLTSKLSKTTIGQRGMKKLTLLHIMNLQTLTYSLVLL